MLEEAYFFRIVWVSLVSVDDLRSILVVPYCINFISGIVLRLFFVLLIC
jgi:hypothetical protein